MLNIFRSCTSCILCNISCTKLSNKNKEEIHRKRIKILPEYKKLVYLSCLDNIKKSFNV